MKTVLICKDCFDQFESSNISENLNSEDRVNIYFTECMGICPVNKISVVEFNKGIINSNQPKSLTPEQVKKIVNI